MPNKDVAIPIVFPDYAIAVNTPPVKINIPDVLPGIDLLPNRVKIPATKHKVKNLGHAGILFIDGATGLTRYFEYGRYQSAKGEVRNRRISDVKLGQNGRPTKASLKRALNEISRLAGHRGRITGAYIELDPGSFIRMHGYAAERAKLNNDPKRASYDFLSNNCMHFAKQVAEAGGAQLPPVFVPHPDGYIVQIQMEQPEVEYSVTGQVDVEDIALE